MTSGSDHRSTGCTATSSFPSGLPTNQKSSILLRVRGVLRSGTTHFLGETTFRTNQLPGSFVRRSRSRTLAAWNLVFPISNCCRKSRKRSETIRQADAAKKSGRCFDLIGIPNECEKKKSLGSSFEPTGRHCPKAAHHLSCLGRFKHMLCCDWAQIWCRICKAIAGPDLRVAAHRQLRLLAKCTHLFISRARPNGNRASPVKGAHGPANRSSLRRVRAGTHPAGNGVNILGSTRL